MSRLVFGTAVHSYGLDLVTLIARSRLVFERVQDQDRNGGSECQSTLRNANPWKSAWTRDVQLDFLIDTVPVFLMELRGSASWCIQCTHSPHTSEPCLNR